MPDRVKIFDTTLRDGEQAAGVSFTAEEKLRIAKMLEHMQVDCIEAGFAAASPADFDAVAQIAREVRGTSIATLCRAVPNDVDQGWEAVRNAEKHGCEEDPSRGISVEALLDSQKLTVIVEDPDGPRQQRRAVGPGIEGRDALDTGHGERAAECPATGIGAER